MYDRNSHQSERNIHSHSHNVWNSSIQKKAITSGTGATLPALVQRRREEKEGAKLKFQDAIQAKMSEMRQLKESQRSNNSGTSKMPLELQAKMESSFGKSFSDVNIYTDSMQAKEMGAQAFAQGKDVHFAPGNYNPQSQSGQELIGHELTHVVQQSMGKVKPTVQTKGTNINNDPSLEKEADEMGKKVAQGMFTGSAILNPITTQTPTIQQKVIQKNDPAEEARIKKLNQDYENSLNKNPRDYEEIAELLNAFNTADINTKLAKLTKGEIASIHAGAIDNKKVGANAQVALLTKGPYLDLNLNNELKKENWKDAAKFLNEYGEDGSLTRVNSLPKDKLELLLKEACADLIIRIRATSAFQALDATNKTVAEEIITEIGKRTLNEQYTYYLPHLKLLFVSKVKTPVEISTETEAVTTSAAKEEKKRVSKPAEAKNLDIEEKASSDPSRKWVAVKGKFGDGTYYVDRSNLSNIVVRAKILLTPKGQGTADTVKNIKSMEDAIEKAASTKGYLVDIEFVNDASDPDTFKVDVDPGAWEVATNWGGGDPLVYAHELHHLFAFELDRYNYIDSHSDNESMKIDDRLHWFREELKKPPGYNDPTSIMDSASHPNDSDVATVAGVSVASRKAAMVKSP